MDDRQLRQICYAMTTTTFVTIISAVQTGSFNCCCRQYRIRQVYKAGWTRANIAAIFLKTIGTDRVVIIGRTER